MDRSQVNAYIDGELSGEELAAIESMIANDPDVKREYLWVSKTKSCVQNKVKNIDNPELWSKCVSRFSEIDRAHRTETIVRKYRGALAGVVAASILGAAYIYRVDPGAIGNENLARTLSAASMTFPSFTPRDETQAATWIRQQLNRETEMPPISQGYLQVVEVGIVDCPDCRVGRVVYTDGENQFYLLAFPLHEKQDFQPVKGARGIGWSRVGTMNAIGWTQGEHWMVFAGPKSVQDLIRMIQ